jgi:hypothetical protein
MSKILLSFVILLGLITNKDEWLTQHFLEIYQKVPQLKAIIDSPSLSSDYRLQLLVREVEIDDQKKTVKFKRHTYRADHEYFYPASAIKTFASISAMLKLQRINQEQKQNQKPIFSIDDPIGLCKSSQKCETLDSSHMILGKVTILHEIKKMQLISSNEAFNHLYNLSGYQFLHERLNPVFPSLRINHRLNTFEPRSESIKTPISQLFGKGKIPYIVPNETGDLQNYQPYMGYATKNFKMGKDYYNPRTKKHETEFNFEEKNGVSFEDFQKLSIGIFFFDLKQKDYHFEDELISQNDFNVLFELMAQTDLRDPKELKKEKKDQNTKHHLLQLKEIMQTDPLKSENPKFSDPALSENRFKPMLQGILSQIGADQRSKLTYFNKAGKALGSHMDNAVLVYEMPKKKKIILVTVGIFVSPDGTINGDDYPYGRYSGPLFKATGEAIGRYFKEKK